MQRDAPGRRGPKGNFLMMSDMTVFKETKRGAVKSVLIPEQADHMLREAVLFHSELIRADAALGLKPSGS